MIDKELRMSFDPRTIEHLGIKMYSRLPNAIAELIANAYDACATEVIVYLNDKDTENKSIVVEDNGVGMTFDEVNEKFLRIGRNRRDEGDIELPCGRMVTGKKGLGKLAFFGIGEIIKVETYKDSQRTVFTLDWEELLNTPSGEDYKPVSSSDTCDKDLHGTTITLTQLKRKTGFEFEPLARSLAKLFNFQDDFVVLLTLNGIEDIIIDNKLKFEGIEPEFSWEFPEIVDELLESTYEYIHSISGKIITTEKPIKPAMRGITLFANGRMVNKAEFFGSSESSHFFSYTTGWLDIDFVDNWDEDVISTNRQSLDWENEKTVLLREVLLKIISATHLDWRKKRKEKRRDKIQKKTNIDIDTWVSTLPTKIKDKVDIIIKQVDDSELPTKGQSETMSALHTLIPEYPNLHWRYLHPEIQKVSKQYYTNQDYYTAFTEALKRYVAEVRKKSTSTNPSDRSLMGEVFSGRKLSVARKFKKSDGSSFFDDTVENIEVGQHYLSEGIVAGGRNPLSHEEHIELNTSGLFSEKDCLDFLSLLSHLFKRLDDAVIVTDA